MELTKKEQAVLDEINGKIESTIEEKNSLIQKQLNNLYERTDKMAVKGQTNDSIERKATNEWLKKFFSGSKDLEQKSFDNYMATDPDASGGYLIPSLLAQEIAHYTQQTGVARMRMRYMPFNGPGNSRRLPKESQGVSVAWLNEGESKPITKISIDQVVHELKKLAAIAVITEELAEDTGMDLTGYVARRIGEAIAREEDRVYFAGDIGDGDPFDGVINATGIVPVTMAAGQGIADITADHLLDAIYALPKEARKNAAFYVHSDVLFAIQKLKDDDNRYLVSRPMADNEPARIWGYPIYTLDVLPSADENEVNLPFAIFADMQKTCIYGDKQGLRVKMLTEASVTDNEGNTVNLAQNDMVGVRVHKRTGYACLHPEGIAILTTGEAT